MGAGRMGRMENGVPADYDFNIADLFREGWERAKGFKATFWQAFGIYFVISLVLLGITSLIEFAVKSSVGETAESVNLVKSICGLIRNFIEYPMVVGLLMMGIHRAVDLPVKASMVLGYYRQILRIIGVVIAMMLMTFVPAFIGGVFIVMGQNFSSFAMGFFMLAGGILLAASFYLMISYLFAVVLTIEKNLGIWRSLEVSRRGISRHWFKVLFTSLSLMLTFVVAAIPLFIGLIWALPMGYCMWGVLYRTIFGVEEARR